MERNVAKATKQKIEAAAVWHPVSELVPWDKNPRVNDHVVDDIANSIKRFGFSAPIVARKADNMVIAGHTRLKAAVKLGLATVPVRFMDLDPADSELLALADNKLNELAFWDEGELARIISELGEDDVLVAGFDEDETMRLLASMDEALPASVREVETLEDGEAGSGDAGQGEVAAAQLRMFQLLLTAEDHPAFMADIETLKACWSRSEFSDGDLSSTEAVVMAVSQAAQALLGEEG